MKLNRVKEILASKEEFPVHYHGVPVWIENVEDATGMAFVSQRGIHDEKRLVSIEGLKEE
jgi:small acid-soluble spore protein H (minor)